MNQDSMEGRFQMVLQSKFQLRVAIILLLIGLLHLTVAFAQWRTYATAKKPAEVTKSRVKATYRESSSQVKKHASLQALFEQASVGVIKVICHTSEGEPTKTGSGFFVSKDGLIVTNWHTISSRFCTGISIETDEEVELKAKVLAIDPKTDLAIVQPVSPTVAPKVFSGCPINEVRIRQNIITIGHSSSRRLLISTGAVNAIRTEAEFREIIHSKTSSKHKYKYLQIDLPVCRSINGGAVLNEKGQVIGIIIGGIPTKDTGFAIEWKAVSDLMKKAKNAVPIGPARISQLSITNNDNSYFGPATTAKDITTAAELAKRNLYCGRCHGTGVILKKVQRKKRELRKILVTGPGVAPHYRHRWVTVTETEEQATPCPLCAGHGISPKFDILYRRLCTLVRTMSIVNETDKQISIAWDKAIETLQEAAFDNIWYARDLTKHARGALSTPQRHLGDPIVFIGKLSSAKPALNATYMLVVVYGTSQPVYVWAPGNITALEGQWCQVAGVIGGIVENIPLVIAVDVAGLHVNPKLKQIEPKPKHSYRRRR